MALGFVGLHPASAQEGSSQGESSAAEGASPFTFQVDPEASRVEFTLGAFMHTVEGSFRVTEGEVRFDPATGEASGRVVVDATSGETGKDKRDRKMHREVLLSGEHPQIVFEAESLKLGSSSGSGGGDGGLPEGVPAAPTLEGTVTLAGDSHPVSIPLEVSAVGGGSSGDGPRLRATGSFRVPYVEWGLEDPSTFFLRVEKHVEVTVHAEGRLRR